MGRGYGWYVVLGAAWVLSLVAAGTAGAQPLGMGWTGARGGLWHDGRVVPLRDARDLPIPSFSRQTKLPCNACHTTFPQLTAFGRLFKLNGYTLTGIEQVRAQLDTISMPTLSLDLIPPVSVMAV